MLWQEIKALADRRQQQDPSESRQSALREAAYTVLDRVRPLGGVDHPLQASKFYRGTLGMAKSAQEVIEAYFPADWLEASKRHSPLKFGKFGPISYAFGSLPVIAISGLALLMLTTIVLFIFGGDPQNLAEAIVYALILTALIAYLIRSQRKQLGAGGEYFPKFNLLSVGEPRHGHQNWSSEVVHEFCHRVEHVVNGISDLEKSYYDSRQRQDEPLILWYPQNGGKRSTGLYEILTTGYQAILFGYQDRRNIWDEDLDPGHRDFVLGLLACG